MGRPAVLSRLAQFRILVRGDPGGAMAVAASLALLCAAVAIRATQADGAEDGEPSAWWSWAWARLPVGQVVWALLGVALCGYHFVRKERPAPVRAIVAPPSWMQRAGHLCGHLWDLVPSQLPTEDSAVVRGGRSLLDALTALVTPAVDGDDNDGDEESDVGPTLRLVDEMATSGLRAPRVSVNSANPIPFENGFFKGKLLFLVNDSEAPATSKWQQLFGDKKRRVWVQVQGQFKRAPPSGATLYLAWELPVRSVREYMGFWMRQLVRLLLMIARRFNPTAHMSLGGDTGKASDAWEFPHVAFPLYQRVDELVVSPAAVGGRDAPASRLPTLGEEDFGESSEHQQLRAALPLGQEPGELFSVHKVYTFQFYSKHCDLMQWKLANVPVLGEVPLLRLCDRHPIRLAAYSLRADASSKVQPSAHTSRAKDYLFCFSIHHHDFRVQTRPTLQQVAPLAIPQPGDRFADKDINGSGGGILSPVFASYVDSAPHLKSALAMNETPLSPTIRQFAFFSRALSSIKFELRMWVERVDPLAGKRAISYLLSVDEPATVRASSSSDPQRSVLRRSVIRSASTFKNVLLLLDEDDNKTSGRSRSFRGLLVESREYLYDRIDKEAQAVATALQEIAADPSTSSEDRYSLQMKRATLYHCLNSPSKLPIVRSYQDIGVQLSASKHRSMGVTCEVGGYRLHSPKFMRQEWILLTQTELLFYRSYSVRPCKTIQVHQVLSVRSVDDVDVLNDDGSMVDGSDGTDGVEAADGLLNKWYCLELHLALEVVTVFVETTRERTQFLRAVNNRLRDIAAEAPRRRLFCSPLLPLEDQSMAVCLNQRMLCPKRYTQPTPTPKPKRRGSRANSITSASGATTVTELVKQALKAGLEFFKLDDREQWTPDRVLAFLDAVDNLSRVDLLSTGPGSSHSRRLAFALNLYHTLFVHAVLVFGYPKTHQQWRKLQTIPSYLIGDPRVPDKQVRFTLREIERVLLRSPMPPVSVLGDGPSLLSALSPSKPIPSVTSPTSKRHVSSVSQAIPVHLAIDHSDFRTCFLLQPNCDPATTRVIRVYEKTKSNNLSFEKQFNRACADFLATELRIDDAARVISLPRVCDWYQQQPTQADGRVATSLAASSSSESRVRANSNGLEGLSGSRAFYCLQRLMGFMDDALLHHVQHLLLGAGAECRIEFGDFWTTQSAAKVISSALSGDADAMTQAGSALREFMRSLF